MAGYGYGWQVTANRGRTQIYHGGGGPGARASFTRFLEDRLSIIVLINMDDVDIDTIVQGLAALHLPKRPDQARRHVESAVQAMCCHLAPEYAGR